MRKITLPLVSGSPFKTFVVPECSLVRLRRVPRQSSMTFASTVTRRCARTAFALMAPARTASSFLARW